MRKIIAAINVTVDGVADHTAGIPDDEIHSHYTELLKDADVILYGRITYQLMEYWPGVVKNPTGNKSIDEFAITIDKIQKIVFSRTLKDLKWKNSRIAGRTLQEEISTLRHESGKSVLIGSPGLIIEATNLNLIDEYQLCIHPVIAVKGLQLFKNVLERIELRLLRTKIFKSGAIILYYEPVKRTE